MIPPNLETLKHSFEIQAQNFDNTSMNFSKKEYLDYTLDSVQPAATDTVLEVAAGTCACGRTFSPFVKTVVCLDATDTMLQVGQQYALENHLHNMIFVKGYAEELPFLDDSFDIVLSRLAFHHFTDTDSIFREMARVLKPGGKLVMIDMEAPDEHLRKTADTIETLRDPSHVKKLSKNEMQNLYSCNNIVIEKCEASIIQVHLSDWLDLTKTSEPVKKQITDLLTEELHGKKQTGFSPYKKDNDIYFNQKWVLTLGKKSFS